MNKLFVTLLLALGLACIAAPARADSDPYVVQIASANAGGSPATVVSTSTSVGHVLRFYGLQVKGAGAAASAWDVRLEGSLDGTNYTLLVANVTGDGDGTIKASTSPANVPARFIRARVASVTLGSATGLNITAIGIDR